MRYYSEPPPLSKQAFGEIYICDHPVYNRCTLYRKGARGLAIIQQRFDPKAKTTWWSEIDAWIANALYLNRQFRYQLEDRMDEPKDGIYPTMTVRQAMWAAKMKPLKKERWETVFDHKDI